MKRKTTFENFTIGLLNLFIFQFKYIIILCQFLFIKSNLTIKQTKKYITTLLYSI